jgi:hypothetical protein
VQPVAARAGVLPNLLTNSFLQTGGSSEAGVLREHLGVPRIPLSELYQNHALPRVGELPSSVQRALAVAILKELDRLESDDASFVRLLGSYPFVPSESGDLRHAALSCTRSCIQPLLQTNTCKC